MNKRERAKFKKLQKEVEELRSWVQDIHNDVNDLDKDVNTKTEMKEDTTQEIKKEKSLDDMLLELLEETSNKKYSEPRVHRTVSIYFGYFM